MARGQLVRWEHGQKTVKPGGHPSGRAQGERRGAIYTRAESRLVTRIKDPEIIKEVHAFKREFNTRVLPPDHGK